MNKKIQIAAIAGAIAFSVMVLSAPSDPIPLPDPAVVRQSGVATLPPSVSVVATGLEAPRAIAIYDDLVFVTEKGGTIRVVQNGTLLERPLAVFRTADVFDGGLLGVSVHPDFEDNRYLYAFVTYETVGSTGDADSLHAGGNADTRGVTLWNKVVRITESGNRLYDAVDIMDGIPGSKFTNGGFLKFGPDGKLYVGTGTVSDASHLPQDLDSLAGKILRLNDDGSIPDDNPFPDSAVYSLGHRNPQGMTWDENGTMYVVEHGPEKNDEVNIIVAGTNYGWPDRECIGDDNGVGAATLCYDPGIEPGGVVFYNHNRLNLEYPFVMTSLRAANLYQVDFDEGLSSQQPILSGVGRIRDVAVHPDDGSIYVITSNTDGKGFPGAEDDRLIRILR